MPIITQRPRLQQRAAAHRLLGDEDKRQRLDRDVGGAGVLPPAVHEVLRQVRLGGAPVGVHLRVMR